MKRLPLRFLWSRPFPWRPAAAKTPPSASALASENEQAGTADQKPTSSQTQPAAPPRDASRAGVVGSSGAAGLLTTSEAPPPQPGSDGALVSSTDPVPRPPLPITGVALVLLLVAPLLALVRYPRPRAQGLEQLIEAASLLQSFPATPDRPVPELWRQRLGSGLAQTLWRRQSRSWLQFWGPHADGAPYLALPASALSLTAGAPLPPQALRLGNLLVIAPDPLSRQVLADRLLPQQRLARGLRRRCLDRLERDQAVLWNPTALAVISGPMAPLLQGFQSGCLSLRLDPGGVGWQGEAGTEESVGSSPTAATETRALNLPDPAAAAAPLPADLLLELQGPALDPLLQGLLSRELIRAPLVRRYGLDAARLELLRRSPFRLRLRPRSQGAFQASLELQISLQGDRRRWGAVLERIATSLSGESYRDLGVALPAGADRQSGTSGASRPGGDNPSAGSPSGSNRGGTEPLPSAPSPSGSGSRPASQPVTAATSASVGATWSREDGVVVGGWRWIGPAAPGRQELLLFLGPVPSLPLPLRPGGMGEGLVLRSRPRTLDGLGLLPPDMPALVRRSEQLWMQGGAPSGGGAGVTPLAGGLRMGR